MNTLELNMYVDRCKQELFKAQEQKTAALQKFKAALKGKDSEIETLKYSLYKIKASKRELNERLKECQKEIFALSSKVRKKVSLLQKKNAGLLSRVTEIESECKSLQIENIEIKTTLKHKKQMFEHNVSAMFAAAAIETKEQDQKILIEEARN